MYIKPSQFSRLSAPILFVFVFADEVFWVCVSFFSSSSTTNLASVLYTCVYMYCMQCGNIMWKYVLSTLGTYESEGYPLNHTIMYKVKDTLMPSLATWSSWLAPTLQTSNCPQLMHMYIHTCTYNSPHTYKCPNLIHMYIHTDTNSPK